MFLTSKIESFTRHSLLFVAIVLTLLPTANFADENDHEFQKILVLGDSLSAGLGVNYEQAWPSLLQKRMLKNNLKYSVVNAGISGDTTSGGLSRLPKLIDKHQPSFLILELGGNDGLRGTSLKAVKKNMRGMIDMAQNKNITVVLMGVQLPPNYGEIYTRSFQDIFSSLASEYGLVLIQGTLKQMITDNLMQSDGIHPNVEGHIEIEKTAWGQILPLLTSN
ncbi:arylesterase [Gammaproteobacteria bacterium]|nr:arylesterase [Gammaproteobacteria bacterium]